MLIDEENRVVAGHGRHEAAKMLGMDHVPTIKLTNMTSNLQRSRSESVNLTKARPMSERIRDLKVEELGISTLKPYARNARTHTNKQIRQIAASIETFGWTNPILIDQDRQVVAGHGRLAAAKLLGLEEIPAIRLSDLTEAQVQAYVIADNRLAELAGWDEELLSIELKALCEIELDFDIEVIGFNTAEIDGLVLGPTETDDDADRVPEIDADAPPITVPGDLWQLGKHRLLCGDARDPRSFETLLDGEAAQMVFTDPTLQRPDRRQCLRARARAAQGVRHGIGRDVRGRILKLP